jgi:hypothetical protein
MLSFKSNQLVTIPPAALAPTLQWLILTDNQLEALPITLPTGLRKVMLTNNKLRQLPDALVECANLELIRLADNALESLPAGLLTMPKLSWMGLAGNPIVSRLARPAPRWFKPSELSFHEQIGAGGGGFVHRATWTSALGEPPVACAVKIFRGAASVTDGDPAHEIDLGEVLSHPNVIRVFGVFWQSCNQQSSVHSASNVVEILLCFRALVVEHKESLDYVSRLLQKVRDMTARRWSALQRLTSEHPPDEQGMTARRCTSVPKRNDDNHPHTSALR